MNWNKNGQANLIVGIICLSLAVDLTTSTLLSLMNLFFGIINILCFVSAINDANVLEGETNG